MHIPFDLTRSARSLADHFAAGFVAYTVRYLSKVDYSLPDARHLLALTSGIVLWHADERFLSIYGRSNDISDADWLEMGSLVFDDITSYERWDERVPLPQRYHGSLRASVLRATDRAPSLGEVDITTEAGLRLEASSGASMTVAASSFPFATGIQAEFFHERFDSEYELAEYAISPLDRLR